MRKTTKLTKKKRKEWEQDWKEHNKFLKHNRLGEPVSFDQYVLQRTGKVKVTSSSINEIPKYEAPRRTPNYPSLDTFSGSTAKPEPKQYSGSRKLVGIGTMHKSNMVPIFSEDEAEDIANMRRN